MSNKGTLVLLFLILLVLVLSSRREGAMVVNAKHCINHMFKSTCTQAGCNWWKESGTNLSQEGDPKGFCQPSQN